MMGKIEITMKKDRFKDQMFYQNNSLSNACICRGSEVCVSVFTHHIYIYTYLVMLKKFKKITQLFFNL